MRYTVRPRNVAHPRANLAVSLGLFERNGQPQQKHLIVQRAIHERLDVLNRRREMRRSYLCKALIFANVPIHAHLVSNGTRDRNMLTRDAARKVANHTSETSRYVAPMSHGLAAPSCNSLKMLVSVLQHDAT